eukprot:gene15114-biopygen625
MVRTLGKLLLEKTGNCKGVRVWRCQDAQNSSASTTMSDQRVSAIHCISITIRAWRLSRLRAECCPAFQRTTSTPRERCRERVRLARAIRARSRFLLAKPHLHNMWGLEGSGYQLSPGGGGCNTRRARAAHAPALPLAGGLPGV